MLLTFGALFFLALGSAGCGRAPAEADEGSGASEGDAAGPLADVAPGAKEEVVPLSDVPTAVIDAAKQAVPGLDVTRVEREMEKGTLVYDVTGTAAGKAFEVEVTADGEVLETEEGDDDGEDDDGEESDGEDD
jgi:hypothetical protein